MVTPNEVVEFWLDEVGPKSWYNSTDALDEQIRTRFGSIWREAQQGACGLWLTSPEETLAYLILTDQLPRNMFRDTPEAFATDASARAAAKMALDRDWDMKIPEPERQFFYLPLMHSENLIDQDRCVRLMTLRMPDTGGRNLPDACAHREIIRLFGRFPYRNKALGRISTVAEKTWMADVGYGGVLRDIQTKEGAT